LEIVLEFWQAGICHVYELVDKIPKRICKKVTVYCRTIIFFSCNI